MNDGEMALPSNNAADVAELRQQLADARLSAEQARISADQLKLDNDRSVVDQGKQNDGLLSRSLNFVFYITEHGFFVPCSLEAY